MSTQVSNPLTLVMNIKSHEDFLALQKLLGGFDNAPPGKNPINNAMDKVGTVHFARFVFLSETQLAVITSYDGNFDVYITAFANILGDIFDALLSHMKDAPPLPVSSPENLPKFLDYIRENDRSRVNGQLQSIYCSYPTLTVQDILGLAGAAS